MKQICKSCNLALEKKAFSITNGKYLRHKCNKCRAKENRKKYQPYNPLYARKTDLKRKYNMTLENYQSLLSSQNNRCKLCNTLAENLKRALAVDHCHTSGVIRGLLCTSCNLALGHLKDSPELILKAYFYLKSNGKNS